MNTNLPNEQKIRKLAELDGWTMHKVYPHVMCYYEGKKLIHESDIDAPRLSRYLTSYDAIIPLIQKTGKIGEVMTVLELEFELEVLQATPSQLCDALLAAHNITI